MSIADVEQLYRARGRLLRSVVRVWVPVSEAAVEDSCQAAWSRLLLHRERLCPDRAFGWVIRTALREAERLSRQEGAAYSLDADTDGVLVQRSGPSAPEHERFEQRERLATLGGLPRRQQRLLWLQALGLSHAEIAQHEGCTQRTVQRQLMRARHSAQRSCALAA